MSIEAVKRRFKISLEEYEELLLKQNNNCAICDGQEKSKRYKRMAVDHCHKNNKLRGILCSHCNRAIGLLKDDVTVLEKAIKYLRKFKDE